MLTIDISCDLGEGDAADALLWPMLTSANIACGGHAGDTSSMAAAVAAAMRFGVSIGAHPSYPDRAHFGRRSMCLEPMALREAIAEQLLALHRIAHAGGGRLSHVKPHGALYNDAHASEAVASTIVAAMEDVSMSLALVCTAGSALHRVAESRDMRVVREGFADRRYRDDGSLVPRSSEGALLTTFEEATQQGVAIATNGTVTTQSGRILELTADTLCIHADTPDAPARLAAIRAALVAAGVGFASCHG